MSRALISILVLLLCLPVAEAWAATITLVSLDGAGEGFNDPTTVEAVGGNSATTLGGQRQFVVEQAAGLWAAELRSDVTILLGASFDELACTESTAQLGQAGPTTVAFGSDLSNPPFEDAVYPAALANSLAGEDLCPETSCTVTHYDIEAQFNSSLDSGACLGGVTFYYGVDGNKGSNQVDLLSTVLHELGHGLGFLSFVDLDSGAKFSASSGSGTSYFNDPYMYWLEDHSAGLTFPNMTDSERLAAITGGADLHWTGAYAIAAASGLSAGRDSSSGHVEMYGPDPAETGSSITHFADGVTPDELMEPFSTATQDLTLTRALLRDAGWQLTSALPCGDVTGDGSVTATDALNVLKTAVGIVVELSCSTATVVCGDVTGEGSVTATDALNILKTAVGIDVELNCPPTTTTTTLPPASTWTEVLAVFAAKCNSCHGASALGGLGGLNDSDAGYTALVGAVAAGCSAKTLVVAGDADSSYLVEKMEQSSPSCGSKMPLGTTMTATELATIRSWIGGGAVKN